MQSLKSRLGTPAGLPHAPAGRRHVSRPPRAAAAPAAATTTAPPAPTTRQPDPALLALTQWAVAAGIKYAPGLRPVMLSRHRGRGVTTTFPLAPGTALASVPPRLALSSSAPPPPGVPAAVWSAAPWFARLATLLLFERAAGAAAPLAPFVAALPQTAAAVGLPSAWGEEEVAQLQVPAMIQKVRQQRKEWEDWHSCLGPYLPKSEASLDSWLWAASCVRSRTFSAPQLPLPLGRIATAAAAAQAAVAAAAIAGGAAAAGGAEALIVAAAGGAAAWAMSRAGADDAGAAGRRVLCPFIDIFNHSSATEACCELDTWSGDLKVSAREAVGAGQEVFINYGAGGNDLLLLLYGFVEDSNPSDTYPLQRLASGSAAQEVPLGSGGISSSAASALTGNATPAAAAGTVAYASLPPQARAMLAAAARAELEGLGSSLEDDLQLLTAFDRLSTADEELGAARRAAAEAEAAAARAEAAVAAEAARREAAAAAAAADEMAAGDNAGEPSSAGNEAANEEGSEAAAALERAQSEEATAAERLAATEAEINALRRLVQGVRLTAVQYRAGKKRLLTDAMAQLE